MITVVYLPSFIRSFNKLENDLQEEVLEKTELFKREKNHAYLKVHKLHGLLKNRFSFSINYKTRIVFSYLSKTEVAFLAIGNHDIYK